RPSSGDIEAPEGLRGIPYERQSTERLASRTLWGAPYCFFLTSALCPKKMNYQPKTRRLYAKD
ncbi:MAG: hypothetical protein ACPL7J_04350, partial [Desulfomonilaceae bacterium]